MSLGTTGTSRLKDFIFAHYHGGPTSEERKVAKEGTACELEKQWGSHLENTTSTKRPSCPPARWRALAGLCQSVLSSADFLYID